MMMHSITILSDDAAHILVDATLYIRDKTELDIMPVEHRFGVVRIEFEKSPLDTDDLRFDCWPIPDTEGILPLLGRAYTHGWRPDSHTMSLENDGNVYWFRPVESRRELINEFKVWKSARPGHAWEELPWGMTVDLHGRESGDKVLPDDPYVLAARDQDGELSLILTETRLDGGEEVRRWTGAIGNDLGRMLRERKAGFGVVQDGAGIWCRPGAIGGGPAQLVGDVRVTPKKQYVVLLRDEAEVRRYDTVTIPGLRVDGLANVALDNNRSVLSTFKVRNDEASGVVTVEQKSGEAIIGPIVWTGSEFLTRCKSDT